MSDLGLIVIGCPGCGRRYRFDAARLGAHSVRVRCRSCEEIMLVDAPPEPAPGAAPPSPSPAQVPPQAPAPSRPLALVADRDPELRADLGNALRQAGYEVEEALDGHQARRLLAARVPHVAFLNAFLPGVLGVTLCAEIKRHPERAAVRIILVGSLYRRDRFVRDPQALYGADGFLDASDARADRVRGALTLLQALPPPAIAPPAGDPTSDLRRLARIIAGDIILYNAPASDREIAAGRFFDTFAEEVREGEQLVDERFPGLAERRTLYHAALREALAAHLDEAGRV